MLTSLFPSVAFYVIKRFKKKTLSNVTQTLLGGKYSIARYFDSAYDAIEITLFLDLGVPVSPVRRKDRRKKLE